MSCGQCDLLIIKRFTAIVQCQQWNRCSNTIMHNYVYSSGSFVFICILSNTKHFWFWDYKIKLKIVCVRINSVQFHWTQLVCNLKLNGRQYRPERTIGVLVMVSQQHIAEKNYPLSDDRLICNLLLPEDESWPANPFLMVDIERYMYCLSFYYSSNQKNFITNYRQWSSYTLAFASASVEHQTNVIYVYFYL